MDARFVVDVRSLLEDLGASIRVDADVDLAPLELGTERFCPTRASRLEATVTNTGAGIVVSGTISAEFSSTCSRCLVEFPLPVVGDVEAFFVPHGRDEDLPEEQEFGYIEEGAIDLMPAMLAALALETPIAPVHAEDCPGICPTCGKDLNEGPCDCEPDTSLSPFAALKDMLGGGTDS